jgi:GDP-L-fucose synthase
MTGVYDLSGKRVYVAGHRGMVGSALVRRLASEACTVLTPTRADVDLRRQADVERWMVAEKPQAVFLAAAKVGGIAANDRYPADFLYDNLMIEANLIQAAQTVGVEKLCSSARPASIRGSPHNRCRRIACSPVRWSPPTSGTPSPRSPA